jgi:hypothetical protein
MVRWRVFPQVLNFGNERIFILNYSLLILIMQYISLALGKIKKFVCLFVCILVCKIFWEAFTVYSLYCFYLKGFWKMFFYFIVNFCIHFATKSSEIIISSRRAGSDLQNRSLLYKTQKKLKANAKKNIFFVFSLMTLMLSYSVFILIKTFRNRNRKSCFKN